MIMLLLSLAASIDGNAPEACCGQQYTISVGLSKTLVMLGKPS